MELLHPCIKVSDLDESLEYYVDHLGLEETHRFTVGGVTNVYLGADEGTAELQLKHDPEDANVEPSGVDHIGFEVDDCDETVEHMVENAGAEIIREPADGTGMPVRFAFISDPDGYAIEVLHELEE